MNSHPPKDGSPTPPPAPSPREELEARLAALVLGEAGEFEAETLRARLAADPELAALHRRLTSAAQALQDTFEDERTAAALPSVPAAPAELSPERRAVLEKLFSASADAASENSAPAEVSPSAAKKSRRKSPLIIFPKISRSFLVAAACLVMAGLIGYISMSRFSSATLMSSSRLAANREQKPATVELQLTAAKAKAVADNEPAMTAVDALYVHDEDRASTPAQKVLSASELVASVSNTSGPAPANVAEVASGASPLGADSLNLPSEQPPTFTGSFATNELRSRAAAAPATASTAPQPESSLGDVWQSVGSAPAAPAVPGLAVVMPPPPPAPPSSSPLATVAPLASLRTSVPLGSSEAFSPTAPPPPPPPAPPAASGFGLGGSAGPGAARLQGSGRGNVAANPGRGARGIRGGAQPGAAPGATMTLPALAPAPINVASTVGGNASFGMDRAGLQDGPGTGALSLQGGRIDNTSGGSGNLSVRGVQARPADGGDVTFTLGELSRDTGGTLVKAGNGTLNLTGNVETYTGGTIISGGALQLGSGTASGTSRGSIQNYGALAFNETEARTYSGTLSGNGSLTKNGTGTMALSSPATDSFSGNLVINAADTVTLGNEYALQDNTLNYSAGEGNLSFGELSNATLGGLSGDRGLAIANAAGAGGEVPSNAVTVFKSVTVTYAANIGGMGGSNQNAANRDETARASAVNEVVRNWAATDPAAAAAWFTGANQNNVDSNGNTVTLAAAISGTGTVVQTERGPTSLTVGQNTQNATYTGAISSGENVTDPSIAQALREKLAAGVTSNVTDLDANGNNAQMGSAFTGFGSLVKTGTGTLTIAGNNTHTGSTIISAGTLVLDDVKKTDAVKDGNTSWLVTGTSSYAGNTTMNGGQINSNSLNNVGSVPAGNAALSGGGLQWAAGTAAGSPFPPAQGAQLQEIQLQAQETQAGGDAQPITGSLATNGRTLEYVIGNATGADNSRIIKEGSGTLTLTANATFGNASGSNRTLVNSGNLQITNGAGAAPGQAARLYLSPPSAPRQQPAPSSAPTAPNADQPVARPPSDVKFPPPVSTTDNAFSTFSLNVSDVAYRLAQAALQNRRWPDPAAVRTEEFLNAFNYHDPAPRPGEPGAFSYELAQNPFESGGDLLRASFQTAAAGRDRTTPLRLTIVLDGSGSMTRADRVETLRAAIAALGRQLRAGDAVSLVMFARTAQVRAIGVPAERFGEIARLVATAAPDGGTNLEEALMTGYQIARETFLSNAQNRVILLTDGAANLGQLDPKLLAGLVEDNRRGGIALDAYGVGWDGYDDTVLEALTRNSDGRYGFLNRPEDVDAAFASKLAGALAPAALDVKLQIEFNPNRVASYRLMGYNNQRLTKEQFRDNTVNAAELAAAEQGTALYNLVLKPDGAGPVGVARARFRDPATNVVRELEWTIRYTGTPPPFDQAAPSLRLAATAAYFAEYLQQSPFAAEVTPRKLMQTLEGVPESFSPDPRPASLADALFSAAALAGN